MAADTVFSSEMVLSGDEENPPNRTKQKEQLSPLLHRAVSNAAAGDQAASREQTSSLQSRA